MPGVRSLGRRARLVLVWVVLAWSAAVPALAQDVVPPAAVGTPDSVFSAPENQPFSYMTSYDLNRSSGSWTQTVGYGFRRGSLAFNGGGDMNTVQDVQLARFGGHSGDFNGQLDFQPLSHWVLTLDGRFSAAVSGDVGSSTRQKQNRLQLRSQYTVSPWRGLTARGLLSTEFQQDHSLTIRSGFAQYRVDSSGALPDTFDIYQQRDSSFTSGRLDGASGQVDWKPADWLSATIQATGSRVSPTTNSYLMDRTTARADGAPTNFSAPQRSESPLKNGAYSGSFGFSGVKTAKLGVLLKSSSSEQGFFDRVLRGQERATNDQRSASLHLEETPNPALQLVIDATVRRTLREYLLRKTSTSLVNARELDGTFGYTKPATRATVHFEFNHSTNGRQLNQNGTTISRFATASFARRITSRLWLDASGTASLLSYQFIYPESTVAFSSDRDNQKLYFSVGGGYHISDACSSSVHFSDNRSHAVAIGRGASGDNVVMSTYQMNAFLQVKAARSLTVTQNYNLSAVYQIYDYSEARNFLSRIKGIDTVVADTIFSPVYVGLVHNYVFRDLGPYQREEPGGDRTYAISVKTYQQNVGVLLGIRPTNGIAAYVRQDLANTHDKDLASGTDRVTNRFTLTASGEVNRTLAGGAVLHAAIQHIGAFTERPPGNRTADLREDAYWIVGASLQKDF